MSRSAAAARASDSARPLAVWWLSRASVALLVLGGTWLLHGGNGDEVQSWLGAWNRWDTGLFVKVARWGYLGYPVHYPDKGVVAFFPGEPVALRVVHTVVGSWVGAGLLISAVAGAVAAVYLARVARLDADGVASSDVGARAVLYLVLSPYAVFLAAAYSESLFLAFALPAWYAARRGRWVVAGVLAAAAATVRITGLFLALALVVQWLTDRERGRRWRDLAPLTLPFLALLGYAAYLHHISGDWLAWQHAQEQEWHRHLTAPWTAFHTTWEAAGNSHQLAAFLWSWRAEIVSVLIGVALTVVLVVKRRWAESVYVGGQVVALATSEYYLSVARTTLLWWPLWVLLAHASFRWRWVHPVYLAIAAPLAAIGVLAFTAGQWVG
jgi:hypothetical protein